MTHPVIAILNTIFGASTTVYVGFDGGVGNLITNTTPGTAGQPCAIPGVVSNLSVTLNVAPGVGTSFTYTLYQNGVATAVTCTVSGTATSATDTTHSVTVAAGDLLCWEVAPANTPIATGMHSITAAFAGSNPGESCIGGIAPGSASTYYIPIVGGATKTTSTLGVSIVPTSFTLDHLYFSLSGAPTGVKSEKFVILKNGVAQSLTATITGSATSATDMVNSVSFIPGDTIQVSIVMSGSPATTLIPAWGMRITPAIDGEHPIMVTGAGPSSATVRYLSAQGGFSAVSGSETGNVLFASPLAMTLRKLSFWVITAPGTSKFWSVTSRLNGAAGNQSVATSGTTLYNQDNLNSDTLTVGSYFDYSITPANGPTNSGASAFSMVSYIASVSTGMARPDLRLFFL